MKNFGLLAFLFIALIMSSCGAKEEKREDLATDNDIVDATIDTSQNYEAYEEFVSDGVDENLNPADSSSKETMIYVDDTKEIQVDPPIEKKEVVKEKPVIKEETKIHEKRYYIVVGSFKEYGNAQKLFNYFKDKGYYPIILPKVNDYNRVAISSFVDEANARKAIKKLRVEHNDLTFWIFKW
ncbi:MAG: SPOR domain-containing protein [Bacteroidales bacterium]|nr:SPOR domain-containing protein [Bacteroidales bacterium]